VLIEDPMKRSIKEKESEKKQKKKQKEEVINLIALEKSLKILYDKYEIDFKKAYKEVENKNG
jgi:hypothetical protein